MGIVAAGILVLLLIVVLMFWIIGKTLGVLILLLVAGFVGWIADEVVPGTIPYGWLGAIIAGLVGSWIGVRLFGTFGPSLAGIPILPAIIGAIILAVIVNLLHKAFAGGTT
jgi:uncharacterized membrane protein YeaQ/YmgE (transglycosylase-associated protein family)